MANSECASRAVEICGSAFLSGQTLLRLFLQYDTDLSGLAPNAGGVGLHVRRRGRLDLGGREKEKWVVPRWRNLSRWSCRHGEHPDADGYDHGRAAGLSALGGILPVGGAGMELAAAAAANRRAGGVNRYGRGLWHANDGAQRGLAGQSESLYRRRASRPQ